MVLTVNAKVVISCYHDVKNEPSKADTEKYAQWTRLYISTSMVWNKATTMECIKRAFSFASHNSVCLDCSVTLFYVETHQVAGSITHSTSCIT